MLTSFIGDMTQFRWAPSDVTRFAYIFIKISNCSEIKLAGNENFISNNQVLGLYGAVIKARKLSGTTVGATQFVDHLKCLFKLQLRRKNCPLKLRKVFKMKRIESV